MGSPVAPPYLTGVPGCDTILLIWNPTSSTELWPRRTLASQLSDDGGKTWYGYRQIEYAPYGGSPNDTWHGRLEIIMAYASSVWVGRTLHLTYLEFPSKACPVFQPRYLTLSKDWLLGINSIPSRRLSSKKMPTSAASVLRDSSCPLLPFSIKTRIQTWMKSKQPFPVISAAAAATQKSTGPSLLLRKV